MPTLKLTAPVPSTGACDGTRRAEGETARTADGQRRLVRLVQGYRERRACRGLVGAIGGLGRGQRTGAARIGHAHRTSAHRAAGRGAGAEGHRSGPRSPCGGGRTRRAVDQTGWTSDGQRCLVGQRGYANVVQINAVVLVLAVDVRERKRRLGRGRPGLYCTIHHMPSGVIAENQEGFGVCRAARAGSIGPSRFSGRCLHRGVLRTGNGVCRTDSPVCSAAAKSNRSACH